MALTPLVIEEYVTLNTPSQYVGTSRVWEGAATVNTQTATPGYLYEIADPGHGIDVNDVYPDNLFAHEQEVAFPCGIKACYITGCTPLNSKNEPVGNFIPNPNYRPE